MWMVNEELILISYSVSIQLVMAFVSTDDIDEGCCWLLSNKVEREAVDE